MIFKSDPQSGDLNGFLDAGSHVRGDLSFENTFRIDGRFNGRISSDGDLVIGDGGFIEGEVQVGRVFISGRVEGQVTAKRVVQIAPTGKVFAELETPSLIVEDGALFEGRCSMSGRSGSKPERTTTGKVVTGVPFKKER